MQIFPGSSGKTRQWGSDYWGLRSSVGFGVESSRGTIMNLTFLITCRKIECTFL
jgi:hypothetical protein